MLLLPALAALVLLAAFTASARGRALAPVEAFWALFAVSVAFFCAAVALDGRLGPVSDLAAIAGGATCGFAWLFARALFRPPAAPPAAWPLVVVGLLIATGALVRLFGAAAGSESGLLRMVANLHGLASSTVLLLALVEASNGVRAVLPRAERRFRAAFAAGYAALLAVSVIWAGGAAEGSLAARIGDEIRVASAFAALLGAAVALRWRLAHPQPAEPGRRAASRPAPTADDRALAARVLRLVRDEAAYAEPDLKVADLARRLGEPEYRVSRAIARALEFDNFNQLVNHHRVEHARRRLADPAEDGRPILDIALECGFSSIGPFNRAFKAAIGRTPREYRRALADGGRPPSDAEAAARAGAAPD